MTSAEISQEARELLAEEYKRDNKPWFAAVALNPRLKQFDVSLRVITKALDHGKV